jgi:hypothetical protein
VQDSALSNRYRDRRWPHDAGQASLHQAQPGRETNRGERCEWLGMDACGFEQDPGAAHGMRSLVTPPAVGHRLEGEQGSGAWWQARRGGGLQQCIERCIDFMYLDT